MESRHIAELLGGRRVLGKLVTSILELNAAVERGLPKATLRNVARRIFSDAAGQRAIISRIVPEATYKRRRERLTLADGAPGAGGCHGRRRLAGSRADPALSDDPSSGDWRQNTP
jgi:hypothetical protein